VIHWQNWEALKQRKDVGGLGFQDLISFNKAMLGKQAWCLFHQPLSLWVKSLKASTSIRRISALQKNALVHPGAGRVF